MEIEKEIRFKIESGSKIKEIELETEEIQEKSKNIDLVLGWKGFESLDKYGFICRIRNWKEVRFLPFLNFIIFFIWYNSSKYIGMNCKPKNVEKEIAFVSIWINDNGFNIRSIPHINSW